MILSIDHPKYFKLRSRAIKQELIFEQMLVSKSIKNLPQLKNLKDTNTPLQMLVQSNMN